MNDLCEESMAKAARNFNKRKILVRWIFNDLLKSMPFHAMQKNMNGPFKMQTVWVFGIETQEQEETRLKKLRFQSKIPGEAIHAATSKKRFQ